MDQNRISQNVFQIALVLLLLNVMCGVFSMLMRRSAALVLSLLAPVCGMFIKPVMRRATLVHILLTLVCGMLIMPIGIISTPHTRVNNRRSRVICTVFSSILAQPTRLESNLVYFSLFDVYSVLPHPNSILSYIRLDHRPLTVAPQ